MSWLLAFCAGAAAATGLTRWLGRPRSRTLGRFVSFAAHEINTPITAVNMTLLNLLAGVFGELKPEQAPWIEIMREQIARLNAMVGELRDLIHLEIHKDLSMRFEDVEPGEAIDTALRSIRHGCAQAGVALETELAAPLPKVRADPDRLPRSLAGMLFHARKFRTAGPIRVRARRAEAAVEIEVSYQGPKLAPEEVRRSMEVYYPASRRKDHMMSATGLGLGVLRLIVRRQGGELRLVVAPDGAAALTLSAPAAAEIS